MSERTLYDVAIIGFGPAGAVAAALLGQAGLDVYVCESALEVYSRPRALALDHEIMRIFQQIGLLRDIEWHFEPFTPSEYYGVDGQLIRRMTMVDPPYPLGYTPSLVFSQPLVERALRQRVARLHAVTVALGTRLVGLQQDANAVMLQVSGERGEAFVRARYVLACDGGASRTRAVLGLGLEDLGFDEPWLVADVLVNERGLAQLPKVSVQYCEPERPCSYIIGPGNHRRWEISLRAGEDPHEVATVEGTWRLLSRWLGPEDGTLWRQASYRFHALVAHRWRAGRVFLAGDAAHMQPPFLGQGLCQALRDVANLSWKLVEAVRGEHSPAANERLLDSYEQERKAHVCELTRRIKAVGALICERDLQRARARDAQLLAEHGGVVRDTPRQDLIPRLEAGLLAARPTSARGTLFPQPRLAASGQGAPALMDAVFGHGVRLVSDGTLRAPPGADLTVIDLAHGPRRETEGVVARWMQRHRCHAALVRPDHYVYGTAVTAPEFFNLIGEWSAALD